MVRDYSEIEQIERDVKRLFGNNISMPIVTAPSIPMPDSIRITTNKKIVVLKRKK